MVSGEARCCLHLGQCTARIWGRGQRGTWNQPMESTGLARAHTPLISLKGGLSQQRLDPESHQHQDEASGDEFFFSSQKCWNEEEMIFFLIQLFTVRKCPRRKIVTCTFTALHELAGQSLSCFNCVECGGLCKFWKRPLWGRHKHLSPFHHRIHLEIPLR